MLPNLTLGQRVYIETTNLIHGGSGHEFGKCLWSPVNNKGGHKSWQLMEEVNIGDIIIHLADIGGTYHWKGVSTVSKKVYKFSNEPPIPDKWTGMSPYQRIDVTGFKEVASPLPIDKVFNKFKKELLDSLDYNSSFYVDYGGNGDLRMAQRYFSNCPNEVYNVFGMMSDVIGYNYATDASDASDDDLVNVEGDPDGSKQEGTTRTEVTYDKIDRDAKIVKELKKSFDYKCQICGIKLMLPNGKLYAQGHHLQPLGKPHNGPDEKNNIIILCPNHHAEFDFGSIKIDVDKDLVIHIDTNNKFHKHKPAYSRLNLGSDYLKYHDKLIFNKD